jgi:hypothetical protein
MTPTTNSETSCWMQTLSGLVFYPLNPTPETILISDIAGALSKMCRFGGHCGKFYSVAEHCVHVASLAPEHLKLAALMHDASEAYLVDIPRPIKPHLVNYREIEDNLMHAIAARFKFEYPMPSAIKDIDMAILSDEREQNMGYMNVEPKLWGSVLPALGVKLKFWDPADAQIEFITAFDRYYGWPT